MPLICVDTETSGLDPATSAIWDLAACAIDGGEIVSRFETLVWPGREMLTAEHREVIERVSGFDVRRLLDADVPDVSEARARFWLWLIKVQRRNGRLTSFNMPFDRAFLEEHPWGVSRWALPDSRDGFSWGPCVMEAAARKLNVQWTSGEWRISLRRACQMLNVPFVETHRAMSDAEAAARLAIKLGIDK